MPNARKLMKPESFENFKKALAEDCRFTVAGSDGFFAVSHDGSSVEVEDLSAAPDPRCETFASTDKMLDGFKVSGAALKDTWRKVTFVTP